MAQYQQNIKVVRVFLSEELVFADGLFNLAVFEVNGGKTLPGKAKMIFKGSSFRT